MPIMSNVGHDHQLCRFRGAEAIPRLEAELGKPVISSNPATFWMPLRAAGFPAALQARGSLDSVQSMSSHEKMAFP